MTNRNYDDMLAGRLYSGADPYRSGQRLHSFLMRSCIEAVVLAIAKRDKPVVRYVIEAGWKGLPVESRAFASA